MRKFGKYIAFNVLWLSEEQDFWKPGFILIFIFFFYGDEAKFLLFAKPPL